MDFSNFDPTEAVLLKADHLTEVNVHETDERPFVDENPCLLCGHKAFANFIDLTLVTSCTSQSSTPVRKKLRDILRKVWVQTKENNILCLACYDLVDRYDSLEAQLNNIRENIEEKYEKTCLKKHLKVRGSCNSKRRGQNKSAKGRALTRKQKKLGDEDKEDSFLVELENDDNVVDNDSDYSTGEHELTNLDQTGLNDGQQIHKLQNAPPPMPVEVVEEVPNLNVYDEHHQLLQRGQKMRLGKLVKDENGMEVYKCGYCIQNWANIAQLHNHVHSYHMPEVVDVAIPVELGMGNTMNCGIELQHVTEPHDSPKPWSCIFCDAAFRARTNMSSHFKEKHTPHKPFLCADCGDAFRKGIDLNRHKLYFCPERSVTFAPKRKYKKREGKERSPMKKKMGAKGSSPELAD